MSEQSTRLAGRWRAMAARYEARLPHEFIPWPDYFVMEKQRDAFFPPRQQGDLFPQDWEWKATAAALMASIVESGEVSP